MIGASIPIPFPPVFTSAQARPPRRGSISQGDSEQSTRRDDSIRERTFRDGDPVRDGSRRTGVEGNAREAGQGANREEGHEERGNRTVRPAEDAGHRGPEAEAEAHSGECSTRPDAVDEPATGQHRDRVHEQKGRVDEAHLLFRELVRPDEVSVGGDRNADAVEVRQKDDAAQHRDDSPAEERRLEVGRSVRHGSNS